eukprot:6212425-Pleurochrysis_carterae.AAC.7
MHLDSSKWFNIYMPNLREASDNECFQPIDLSGDEHSLQTTSGQEQELELDVAVCRGRGALVEERELCRVEVDLGLESRDARADGDGLEVVDAADRSLRLEERAQRVHLALAHRLAEEQPPGEADGDGAERVEDARVGRDAEAEARSRYAGAEHRRAVLEEHANVDRVRAVLHVVEDARAALARLATHLVQRHQEGVGLEHACGAPPRRAPKPCAMVKCGV